MKIKTLLLLSIFAVVTLFTVVKVYASGDLIGYWNFDETSGTQSADASGNDNHGTFNGSGVTHSTDLPPTSCFINTRSLSFDGTGGHVTVPDNTTMDPPNQISIAFWAKPDTVTNGYQHMVFKQGPYVTSYGVWLAGDHVYMEDNDNSIRSLTSNAALSAGDWHYITVTYDGINQKLYLDGVLDNWQSLPGITLEYTNSPVKIGSGDYNNPFAGHIDDLRIYGRALTDQEIADLAGGGCGPGVAPNNGIAPGVEDAAPNGGDANDDSTPDSQQGSVASFLNTQTNHYTSVSMPGSCTLTSVASTAASANAAADTGYSYPAGFTGYSADCGTPGYTATVTLYEYGVSEPNLILRKYNPAAHTYTAVPDAVITHLSIGGRAVTKVVYQVTDGGPLDTDGTANGTIVDPVGLALASPTLPTTPAILADTGTSTIATTAAALLLTTVAVIVSGKFHLQRKS